MLSDKATHRQLILEKVEEMLPVAEGPLYPEDSYTLETVKDMASEIIREKCFELMHQEIPYGLAVQVRKYEEADTIDKIYADIILDKESYKSILLGKSGQHIKRIGQTARLEIEKMLGKKVYLDLHVKVKNKWTKNPNILKELGYVTEV